MTTGNDYVKEAVENACRAWYNAGIELGQYRWDKLVELDDHRITIWRRQMRAALDAIAFFELVAHHRQHHIDVDTPLYSAFEKET